MLPDSAFKWLDLRLARSVEESMALKP